MEGMYVGGQFWDGRANTLEDQAKQPFLNPLEMRNANQKQVVQALLTGDYALLFLKVCGMKSIKNVDAAYDCVAGALAEYMRTDEVSPFDSKFDYYLAGKVSLTEAEARGYALFTGAAKCSNYTSIAGKPLFTNFGHQNTGVPKNPDLPFYGMTASLNPGGANYVDLGLGAFLRQSGVAEEIAAKEDGKFKIPSLRNGARTAPYMHNGVFETLYEVISFNNTRDVATWPASEVPRNVHRRMPPMPGTFGRLGLTEENINDLVAFLRALTDGYLPPEL
jgi:cytochrome c peroxidase